jgi:F0F1-type ATP synthase membrane subunit b/b'
MADARRQIQDIIDTAQDEITRIGQTLLAMGDQPSLLGCRI